MGKIKKLIYFTVLADREEIAELSSYDRSLIYASFVRQTLGATFAFLVFLYACASVMPLWASIVVAMVLASIIFFLDQAIIGSEWSMHRDLSRHWLINGPLNFVVKIIQLLPRIIYAVAIAWFMATLAEITLQSRAIDRVLNEQTRENNTVYFERTDELAQQHLNALQEIDAEISELQETILARSDPTAEQNIALLEAEVQNATDIIGTLSSRATSLREQVQDQRALATNLNSQVTSLSQEIAAIQDAMDDEVNDPNRCRSPGDEGCKGRRWTIWRNSLIPKEDALRLLLSDLAAAEELLATTLAVLDQIEVEISDARDQAEAATTELQQTRRTTSSLDELNSELSALLAARATLVVEQDNEKAQLEQTLISTGYRDVADYGPLDRRLGLQVLHDHPEYGAVARQFSWELKVVVILFELSPVLVTLFFTPFSFLSLRMRQKREIALADDIQQRREREANDLRSSASFSVGVHAEETKADQKMSDRTRDAELSDAQEQDLHDEEMLTFEKRKLEREAELADFRQEILDGKSTDNDEYRELQRELELEMKRRELYDARSTREMFERASELQANRNMKGKTDD